MKKADQVIPQIIAAKNNKEAIAAIKKTMQLLHLTSDYVSLNNLKTQLEKFEADYKKIERKYRELASPRIYEDIHEIRTTLNFLYRDASDILSFEISKNKIYWEERKSILRADSILEMSEDENIQSKVKAKSTSALRDIYGASSSMKEFNNLYSIAYGLFKNLETFFNSLRMLSDSIASEERYILTVLQKDVK